MWHNNGGVLPSPAVQGYPREGFCIELGSGNRDREERDLQGFLPLSPDLGGLYGRGVHREVPHIGQALEKVYLSTLEGSISDPTGGSGPLLTVTNL